jgi:hypothetical protein
MSKIKSSLEKTVMQKIKSGDVVMKPKWYFAAGSILMAMGLVGLSISSMFLLNLTMFLIRKRGPGLGRLDLMLDSFPMWIPVVAVLGIVAGVWILKKYDFSYKKNFWYIICGFIISIVLAAFVVDYMGLNETWSHRGPMQRFYRQIGNETMNLPGNSWRQGVRNNNY